LGCTLGYIGWGMWWTLLSLWPVLLISIGVKILGRAAGQSWISALAPLLIWAALFYAAGTAWTGAYGLSSLPMFDIRTPITFTINGL
jgi:hypothetical protein